MTTIGMSGVGIGGSLGIRVDIRWIFGGMFWLGMVMDFTNIFVLLLFYFVMCVEFIRHRLQEGYGWILG